MNINYSTTIKISIGIAVLTNLLMAGAAQPNAVSADVYSKIQDASVQLQSMLQYSGRLEATGTHFELNNTRYLNITLDSSEPIKLALESIPEMVTMHIESASNATSTRINLSGFAPETIYHKYEDDYHNHVVFTTDANGNYTYIQDISGKHIVFIQPRASTIFINDNATGGDCELIPVGTWNAATRTCKLNTDLTDTVQIDSDGVTLDGDLHTSTGSNTGSGVYLPGRIGVTVINMNIEQFTNGILMNNNSLNNNVTGNNASNNSDTGILLESSNNNTLRGNNASNNSEPGIFLDSSSNNMLSNNNASKNLFGIGLNFSSNNTLNCNDASNNAFGIVFVDSSNNTLSSNIASNNNATIQFGMGIGLVDSNNNTLTGNNALNNTVTINGIGIGIGLLYSNNNTLRGNNASYNTGNIGGTNFSIGIALASSNNNTVSDNNVSNNAIGILFADIGSIPGFEAVLLTSVLIAVYYMKRGRRSLV